MLTHRSQVRDGLAPEIDFNYENLENDMTPAAYPYRQSKITRNATRAILTRRPLPRFKTLCTRLMSWAWPVDCPRIQIRERNPAARDLSSAMVALYLKRNNF